MHITDAFYTIFPTAVSFCKKTRNRLLASSFWVLMLCPLPLAGCADNIVALSYPSERETVSSAAKKNIAVCIVDFANKRETAAIGKRMGDAPLLPRTPVERWLAAGLAIELHNAGYRVSMAETLPAALTHGADYLVIGEAEEVWLAETSLTRYTGTIRASISLLDGKGTHITRNAYNSVYSKAVLPVYGVPRSLLDDALAEMLAPAVRMLATIMQ